MISHSSVSFLVISPREGSSNKLRLIAIRDGYSCDEEISSIFFWSRWNSFLLFIFSSHIDIVFIFARHGNTRKTNFFVTSIKYISHFCSPRKTRKTNFFVTSIKYISYFRSPEKHYNSKLFASGIKYI